MSEKKEAVLKGIKPEYFQSSQLVFDVLLLFVFAFSTYVIYPLIEPLHSLILGLFILGMSVLCLLEGSGEELIGASAILLSLLDSESHNNLKGKIKAWIP